jgi:hypothetical protein
MRRSDDFVLVDDAGAIVRTTMDPAAPSVAA